MAAGPRPALPARNPQLLPLGVPARGRRPRSARPAGVVRNHAQPPGRNSPSAPRWRGGQGPRPRDGVRTSRPGVHRQRHRPYPRCRRFRAGRRLGPWRLGCTRPGRQHLRELRRRLRPLPGAFVLPAGDLPATGRAEEPVRPDQPVPAEPEHRPHRVTPETRTRPRGAVMASRNVENHRAGHEAFNQRDFEAMTKHYAESIAWADHPQSRTFTTPQQFTDEFLAGWVRASSDIRIVGSRYLDGGETVVCTFT